MARRTLLIIASILLAALGTALIWLYVQGAENRAQQSADLVPVLFLSQDVKVGQSPANAVTPRQLPASAAGNAVTNVGELAGQRMAVDAVAGEVLLKSMLTNSSANNGRFPAGGAASITIADPNRVPADLQPGDVVDIVVLSKTGADIPAGFSNIRVRTVGPAHAPAAATGSAGGSGQNATIPPTIVGLDIKDAATATRLYDVVARGDQVALYLHNGTTP